MSPLEYLKKTVNNRQFYENSLWSRDTLSFFNLSLGTTRIYHDSEYQMQAERCLEAGCYNRTIVYNATVRQMEALKLQSQSCRQLFRFDCLSVPFNFNGVPQGWWIDIKGDRQYYWAGNNATVRTCQCGIDNDCVISDVKCNCDTLAAVDLFDQGIFIV